MKVASSLLVGALLAGLLAVVLAVGVASPGAYADPNYDSFGNCVKRGYVEPGRNGFHIYVGPGFWGPWADWSGNNDQDNGPSSNAPQLPFDGLVVCSGTGQP